MTTHWVEEKLAFSFDKGWHLVRWDKESAFSEGVGVVQGCPALDFCGVRERAVYLIEVKDFRGHRAENKHRLAEISSDSLADELGRKVCATVAGLVGAHRTQHHDEERWKPFAEALLSRRAEVRVILWLEEDVPRGPDHRMTFSDRLKKKLRWLTPKVLVASLPKPATWPPGLTVQNMPGAGGRGGS